MTEPQPTKRWNPFVAGAKGGLTGCVGCLVFVVLAVIVLFLLIWALSVA